MTSGDVWVLAPMALLLGGALAVYLVGRFITSRNTVLACATALFFAATLASVGVLAQRVALAGQTNTALPVWGCLGEGGACLRAARGGLYMVGMSAGMGIYVSIYSGRYLALDRRYRTYYPLLLLMVAGLVGMVMTTDLFSLYLFCELMSVAAYVLVAFRRQTDTSIEAGYKYLVMGSAGTLTLLFGLSLVYWETGVLSLPNPISTPGLWARVGLACIIVGLAVKSAIVPAHTWLPDAYGRAPSSVSAMFSGSVIQSSFFVMVNASLGLGFPERTLGLILMACGVLNMTLGNVMALVQVHTKRMLAYSTIAQMGYALFSIGVGLRHGIPDAVRAGFFLILAHAAMKALAFMSKGICHFYCGTSLIEELKGTYQRLPVVAVSFTIALVGLAGVSPLAGFAGKWLILSELYRTADWVVYVGIAVFLLNTLVSLGYYLPAIAMLFTPAREEVPARIRVSGWMAVPVVGLTLLVLALGVAPGPWLRWSEGLLGFW